MASYFPVTDANQFGGIDFFREGMPLRSIATTTTGNFTNGQTIVGYSPTPTMVWWVEDIALSSNMDAKVDIYANGALLGYTFLNKTTNLKANVSQIISIKQWIPEGQSVGIVARENLTGLSLDSGVSGFRNTNDLNYGALKVIVTDGDSITNTIGATYLEGFYNGILRDSYISSGISTRLINKGNGSFTSSNMEYLRATGQLNVNQANLILYMLGTNDNNLSVFQSNFNSMVAWKKKWLPTVPFIAIGPVQYVAVPAQEANVAQFRSYMQSTVAAQPSQYRFYFLSYAGLLTPNTTDYNSDLIHPNAAGQLKMGNSLVSFVTTNNIKPL